MSLERNLLPAQRPSWNYLAEDGGMMLDTFPHWYYVPENLFGRVQAVTAKAVTHIPERWDEQGCKYAAAADDTAYAIFELQDDVIAQVNSSWAVRVDRGELVEFQVDGTHGSAVAGLFGCCIQTAWRRPCRSGPLTCPRPRLPQPVAPDPDTPSSPTGAGAVGRVEDVEPAVPTPTTSPPAFMGFKLADAALESSTQGRLTGTPPSRFGLTFPVRARRGRSHGHRAAQHGPGLAGDPAADHPQRRARPRTRRPDRLRRRHRSAIRPG